MILQTAILITMGLIAFAILLNLFRMAMGPRTLDRIVGLDTMYINAIAMIILVGMYVDTDLYFEAAVLIAMMGFVGTVALSKYFLRGDIIE
jgi:multicomponent K+:H+ antiporter subunit F